MVDVYVTSAFSKNNKGGNKAGIILNMLHLEYSKKLEISKNLGILRLLLYRIQILQTLNYNILLQQKKSHYVDMPQ